MQKDFKLALKLRPPQAFAQTPMNRTRFFPISESLRIFVIFCAYLSGIIFSLSYDAAWDTIFGGTSFVIHRFVHKKSLANGEKTWHFVQKTKKFQFFHGPKINQRTTKVWNAYLYVRLPITNQKPATSTWFIIFISPRAFKFFSVSRIPKCPECGYQVLASSVKSRTSN